MAPCPPGTQASADLRFCEPCKGGDFNLKAGGTCRPCPMGADCPAGDRLEALPDWWCVAARSSGCALLTLTPDRAGRRCVRRSTNTSALLFSCPMQRACQPGAQAGDYACAEGCGRIPYSCSLRPVADAVAPACVQLYRSRVRHL